MTGLIVILYLTIAIGCTGCFSTFTGNDATVTSVVAEKSTTKVAVIVKFSGIVSEEWAIAFEKAISDPKYDLVVLWIESPGGGLTTTKILAHKLETYKKKYNKTIFVYSERLLASGAYWIASSVDKIFISPAGRAGSIGVYMVRVDASEFYRKWGIKFHYIASDSTKVMGNDASKMAEWERKYWQASINRAHHDFMLQVWKHRKVQLRNSCHNLLSLYGVDTVKITDSVVFYDYFRYIANGLPYSAEEALFLGLIDGHMYFDRFVTMLYDYGYVVVTFEGKIIDNGDFYPMVKEKKKEKEKK